MKYVILAATFTLCASLPAFAQEQPPPTPGGHGMFMQSCGGDIKTFCGSAQTRDDRRACVMANKDKFSDTCKSFMANHPMHPHNEGQMQGSQSGGGR